MYLLLAVAILLVILGVVAYQSKKRFNRPPDYYTMFVLGIIWVGSGIALMQNNNYSLFIMGLVFMTLGLANKDKWEKNRVRWKDLTEEEKKMKKTVMIGLGILLVLGLVAFFAIGY